jgi:hypothetical protein
MEGRNTVKAYAPHVIQVVHARLFERADSRSTDRWERPRRFHDWDDTGPDKPSDERSAGETPIAPTGCSLPSIHASGRLGGTRSPHGTGELNFGVLGRRMRGVTCATGRGEGHRA